MALVDRSAKRIRSRSNLRWLGVAWLALSWSVAGGEFHVTPAGTAAGDGSAARPWDLASTLAGERAVPPGSTVWVHGGRYESHLKSEQPLTAHNEPVDLHVKPLPVHLSGTAEAPVVVRAVPGERATVANGLDTDGAHLWLWGLELVGPSHAGVWVRGGDGLRLINLVIHDNGPASAPVKRVPSGQGIGAWDVGNDQEIYGCLIYHNGWNTLDHGIYTQNTAKHTTKTISDNIIFENSGYGIHAYGSEPILRGFVIEGNFCYATGMKPEAPMDGQGNNLLVGGSNPKKALSEVTVRGNCTWHPLLNSKRGADIGYINLRNTGIVVEDNIFTGGNHAAEIKGMAQATVRGNTFWSPAGPIVLVTTTELAPQALPKPDEFELEAATAPPAPAPALAWEGNTFYRNGIANPDEWRKQTGLGATDTWIDTAAGRPTGTWSRLRANRYEPGRYHLAVYNWDRLDRVSIDVREQLKDGQRYRLLQALDYYGEPVAVGTVTAGAIEVPMTGHRHEPEFGAYVLLVVP